MRTNWSSIISSLPKQVLPPLCALALIAAPTQAATYTWTGLASDGDWNNSGNWDVNGVPVDTDGGVAGLDQQNPSDNIIISGSAPTVNVPLFSGGNAFGGGTSNTPEIQMLLGTMTVSVNTWGGQGLIHRGGAWSSSVGDGDTGNGLAVLNYNIVQSAGSGLNRDDNNHTKAHHDMRKLKDEQVVIEIDHIEKQCKAHGIPKPTTFAYPGYHTSEAVLKVLKQRGYQFARTGGGKASQPDKDNPLLLPDSICPTPKTTFEQLKKAADAADATHIPIFTFHGVPDAEHNWVSTKPELFEKFIQYLKDNGFKAIALRDYPVKR